MRKQSVSAFTVIELAIIILIIGSLFLLLMPKMAKLAPIAHRNQTILMANNLNAVSVVNYTRFKLGKPYYIAIHNCVDVARALPGGKLPGHYSIASKSIVFRKAEECTVINANGNVKVGFTGLGTK